MGRLEECDAILICVPTPLGDHFEPDLSFVKGSVVGFRVYDYHLL
jgi:UDP-N-acetyl-D-glucosamine dehydrogenase